MSTNTTPPPASTSGGGNVGTPQVAEETTHRAASITLSTPWVKEVGPDAVSTYVRTIVGAIPQITAAATQDDAEKVFRSVMAGVGMDVEDLQVTRMTEQIRVARGVIGFDLGDGTVLHDPHAVTGANHTPPSRQETDPESDERPTYS